MAASSSPALRRIATSSPRHGRRSSVTFDKQTSVYEGERLELRDLHGGDEEEELLKSTGGKWRSCYVLVEKRHYRQFFRFCAFINILSLIFSPPFEYRRCVDPDPEPETGDPWTSCTAVFAQFVFVTCVDFVLSLIYTFQSAVRVHYAVYLNKNRKSPQSPQFERKDHAALRGYTYWLKLLSLITITASLWYSFAIGVYRCVAFSPGRVNRMADVEILAPLHILFVPRSLAIFSAMRLFLHVRLPYSALQDLLQNIKWKQLGYVALFYLFFIYMYALLGVQWIGGLSGRCVDSTTHQLAIPVTHCNSMQNISCFGNENIVCSNAPNGSSPLNMDFRNGVYFGQFRFILDALYAVYEASSWELWFFMEITALTGAPRSGLSIAFFFITMILYLVILIQQSIFLVVIIESFAGLRSESTIGSAPKSKNKPLIVLYEQPGSSEERLRLKAVQAQESKNVFTKKLNRWYFRVIEKVFLILVLLDAAVTAIKFSNMPPWLIKTLQYWQFAVSILFVLEISGLLIFHLYYSQYKQFFKTPYYWYLIVFAVGGLVAAIPIPDTMVFYNPQFVFNGLAIFQALRLPRLLRLNIYVKRFFFKVLGDGTRLAVIIVMTLVFLVWFSIISMQFFGFLNPENGCERVSGGNFDNFLTSVQSVFQLVMQEGWTELTTNVMCHRNGWWILINFYFIVVHLFASLILLNFFVAVILDNLDYDEEKKVKKLEQEMKTRKIEKVPIYLKLFKCCGPKRVRAPKLSSADAPNLTEADVKNFYNTGEAADFSRSPFPREQPHIPPDVSLTKRSSELTNLGLLSADSSSILSTDASSHHGKYWSIQGILSYVKAFRQQNREKEEARPHDSLGGRASYDYRSGVSGQLDASPLVRSEYDEYREKYHLFDSALFCMPPEHKLRAICRTILTAQMDPPKQKLSDTNPDQLRKIVKNLIAFVIRHIVSRLPYFTWVMFIVTLITIGSQVAELFLTRDELGTVISNPQYIWLGDLIFVVFTLTELILKILANGFFLNPNAAIRSMWDVLDWLITLSTLITMIAYLSVCGFNPVVPISFQLVPSFLRILLIVRALRPLRTISLVPSMRGVLGDVAQGWKKFLLGSLLLVLFMFMFANLGVQLFAGDNSPQGFCNDPRMETQENCTGEFNINIDIGREIISDSNKDTFINVPRVWYPYRRDFRFDTIAHAYLTLFEVLTLEGWLDVRDMFNADGMLTAKSEAWYMGIYLHIFVFFGVNLGLQLFVGIVVNNFNEHKPDHSALLTVSQKRWTDLMQRISLARPIKQPPEPRDSLFRLYLYKLVVSRYYRHFSSVIILLNSAMFVAPWVEDPPDLLTSTKTLMGFSIAFSVYFILELGLKMLAFGPLRGYFHSWRNVLDFLLSLLGFCFIICAVLYLAGTNMIALPALADLALVLAILKCFTLLGRYSTLQTLTITVGNTIFRIVSLFGVFLAIIITYTFVGDICFSQVRSGQAIDYSFVNFNGIFPSMNLVIRVFTGEDWHQLLWDTMTTEPYCTLADGNCGFWVVSVLWFLSYYVFVTFILLNVVIAVLLENFSIFYNEDDTALSHTVVKDFKQNWYHFDKNASGSIPARRMKLFLRMLRLPRLYTYNTDDNGLKERLPCPVLSDSLLLREMAEELKRDSYHTPRPDHPQQPLKEEEEGGETGEPEVKEERHSFQAVLKMLAYRAEDISKRLVPHQLYSRGELEESVQFDVAEACILSWMKCFVKPVLMKQQERQRRRTRVSVIIHRPLAKRDESVWGLPMISIPTEDTEQELSQLSQDTEDESEASSTFPRTRPRLSLQQPSNSEEQMDAYTPVDVGPVDGGHKSPLLARSYARLAQAPAVHFPQAPGAKDKWHDWFKMQKEWLDNVHDDPENYFDDFL